jgi:hypothetical protein
MVNGLEWSPEDKSRVSDKMTTVSTVTDVWSGGSDHTFVNQNQSRFGEVIISSQVFPFKMTRLGRAYFMTDNTSVFPDENFYGMTVLEATLRFIDLVDELNQKNKGEECYFVPGLDIQWFIYQNKKVEKFLGVNHYYFFAGANLRDKEGNLLIPVSKIPSPGLSASRLNVRWNSVQDRFILLRF